MGVFRIHGEKAWPDQGIHEIRNHGIQFYCGNAKPAQKNRVFGTIFETNIQDNAIVS